MVKRKSYEAHYAVHSSNPPPPISFPLGPNILLSTLFLNSLNLCSCLSVRDRALLPYKTTDKITVL
jgi:hypothetical protein